MIQKQSADLESRIMEYQGVSGIPLLTTMDPEIASKDRHPVLFTRKGVSEIYRHLCQMYIPLTSLNVTLFSPRALGLHIVLNVTITAGHG